MWILFPQGGKTFLVSFARVPLPSDVENREIGYMQRNKETFAGGTLRYHPISSLLQLFPLPFKFPVLEDTSVLQLTPIRVIHV